MEDNQEKTQYRKSQKLSCYTASAQINYIAGQMNILFLKTTAQYTFTFSLKKKIDEVIKLRVPVFKFSL